MSLLHSWLLMLFAGLFCGFVDAGLGMGYGVTSATVLVSFGIAPAIASASVHSAEMIVDAVSAFSHYKLKNVELKISKPLVITGILGAVLGAVFLVSVTSLGFAKPYIRIVLLCMGLFVLYKHLFRGTKQDNKRRPWKNNRLSTLGFIAGFIDVSGGGGWGPILTPTLLLKGSNPRKVVGTVEFTEPFISLAGVLMFGIMIGFDKFLWNIVVPMTIGGIILTPIASWLVKKLPRRALGILIGLWLVILNLYGLLK